jgi:hypothetical protein
MTVRRGAKLELDADVGAGGERTGEFELDSGIEITTSVRTGKLFDGRGSGIISAVGEEVGVIDEGRAGFSLDIGGGALVVDVQFVNFEGSAGQWGDGSNDDRADATGDEVFRQLSILTRYLQVGTFDSDNPARLSFGEFGNLYPKLTVTPEEPRLSVSADDPSRITGNITLVSTRAFDEVLSVGQDDR